MPLAPSEADPRELRLFLEEICCNLIRFQHSARDSIPPESVSICQEVDLGIPGAFADIRVKLPNAKPYFVEVKYGYPRETIVAHLSRKYGPESPLGAEASKLILMVDSRSTHDLADIEKDLRERLRKGLPLEVWGVERLISNVNEAFDLKIESFESGDIIDLRQAMDRAKGRYAFGESYVNDPLQAALLYHFGFWRLRQLRESRGLSPREILPPGLYQAAVVLFADLSSFSSYVRDTRDDKVIRHILMSFYSKTRNEVLNRGGIMYQFLGDGAIALFGVPEPGARSMIDSLDCARSIIDIGNSVSHEWQRSIDQVQSSGGAHIGMAIGDLNVLPQRPFGRAHMAVIGESVNLSSRLTNVAGPGEIVVSNALFNSFPEAWQSKFVELEPVEAKNMGRIKSWKLSAGSGR
jgi:class 3 adenylate cyclase